MTNEVPREIHLAVIRKQFPGIALDALRQDAGGEHYVYVVDARIVFRFPQTRRRISAHRKIAMDDLAASGAVPFALPLFDIHHDDEYDLWFEVGDYLPGVSFTPKIAAMFSDDAMMTIARQLATFLNTLHAFPLSRAREIGMDEMDPTDFWEYMAFNPNAYPLVRQVLWPVVPAEERIWIERLFEEFIEDTRRTPLPLTVRHNDMFHYHIIVNLPEQTLSGVIDFNWRVADPAGDFKAFEYYGQSFLDEVYAHYRHPVDPGFDSRRLFYTGHDEVFKAVRSYLAGDSERITASRESLSAYICAHPLPAG